MFFIESTLRELYHSTIAAFPNCAKRQNSTNEIVITKLEWTPFVGMKTLRVKGLAQNRGNGHEYSPEIVFKQINYHNDRNANGLIEIIDNIGKRYLLEKIHENEILVKCECNDYFWRFRHKNFEDHSHQGRDRTPYTALYNPGSADVAPGLCKHIIKLAITLNRSGLID